MKLWTAVVTLLALLAGCSVSPEPVPGSEATRGKTDGDDEMSPTCVSGTDLATLPLGSPLGYQVLNFEAPSDDGWTVARTIQIGLPGLAGVDDKLNVFVSRDGDLDPAPASSWCVRPAFAEALIDSVLADIQAGDHILVFYSATGDAIPSGGSGDDSCVWNEGTNFRPCGDCGWQFCLPSGVWSDACEGAFACGMGQSCGADGACSGSSDVSCDGAMVDVLTDPENCGACGLYCAAGEICDGGVCVLPDAFRCVTNGDCMPGEVCLDNECTAGMSSGLCTADGDCAIGEVCDMNYCIAG